jgi:nicotinamidase-related amidase
MNEMKNRALLCIDFIHEIVDPGGKLAGKGYAAFAQENDSLARAAEAQTQFRDSGELVVHVRVGFSPTYIEHPAGSPLFGRAKEFQALTLGSWGTEFADEVRPHTEELVVTKHRVSAFFGTALDSILRARSVHELIICGVATDLAVESAARDAHDRDYRVTVLSDCCIAANETDHRQALQVLTKVGRVCDLGSLPG